MQFKKLENLSIYHLFFFGSIGGAQVILESQIWILIKIMCIQSCRETLSIEQDQ